jgi:hypothetical protein
MWSLWKYCGHWKYSYLSLWKVVIVIFSQRNAVLPLCTKWGELVTVSSNKKCWKPWIWQQSLWNILRMFLHVVIVKWCWSSSSPLSPLPLYHLCHQYYRDHSYPKFTNSPKVFWLSEQNRLNLSDSVRILNLSLWMNILPFFGRNSTIFSF